MPIQLLLQKETGEILVNNNRLVLTNEERQLLQFVLSERERQFNRRFGLPELASLMAREGDTLTMSIERFQLIRNSISEKIQTVVADLMGEIPDDFKVLTMRMGVYDFHDLIQVSIE